MSGGRPALRVLPDADAVALEAAELIASELGDAIATRGMVHWVTTGGSAAPPIYRRLGTPPLRDGVAWDRVHVWWGDDRFVPPDHPLSNVLPLEQILLGGEGAASGVQVPADHLHPIPVAGAIGSGGPRLAAERYAVEMREAGPPRDPAGIPVFDLVIVGVGPDGHLLSVFPGSAVWDADELCVAVPAPGHVEPHVERVTMHPAVLGAARVLLLVTTGSAKAGVLGRAWTGDDERELPLRAARLGTATWILDEAAAAELPRERS